MQHDLVFDPTQWDTLRQLLDTALDLPEAQRPAWIESLGAEHENLKSRLRSLLAHAAEGTGLLAGGVLPRVETAQILAAHARPRAQQPHADQRIGPYRLLRPLGEGGMGEVWLAERDDMLQRRQVALKLPHLFSGRAALAERMAREREILAALNHPNIARLYDAGVSADGQPYLALEYVEGERIDAYCRRKTLDVPARLRLFMQVARAVAHAHANLVVHRDLKPTNVLVTDAGDVRLLDFGIAKLLEDGQARETALTQLSGRALTPDYASPEQILGQPIGTAADVYSLGVLLFELLTGKRPYKLSRDSRAALEDAIVRADVQHPSAVVGNAALKKRLRGDLDTIVLKALKYAPAERYATADAFAADVERHLLSLPVSAQPDRAAYRVRKFVARHRATVFGVSAFAVVLAATAGFALLQMTVARAQRDEAVRQQQRASATSEFLGLLMETVGDGSKPLTLTEVLDRGTAMLESQTRMEDHLAASMLYEASRHYATLGNTKRELEVLRLAEAAAERAGDADALATTHCAAAIALADGDPAAAEKRRQSAVVAIEGRKPSVPVRVMCARAEALLSEARGDTSAAIATLVAARRDLEQAGAVPVQATVAILNDLAHLYYKSDRAAQALVLIQETLQLRERSGRGATIGHAIELMNFAAIVSRAGEVAGAERQQRRALEIFGRADANRVPPGIGLHLATSLIRLARPQEALRLLDDEIERSHAGGNKRMAALSELQACRALLKLGRLDEAQVRLDAAESGLRVNAKANERMLNEATLMRAELDFRRGHADEAISAVRGLLARQGYPERTAPGMGSVLFTAARLSLERGQPAEAAAFAEAGLKIVTAAAIDPAKSADVGQARMQIARARAALGDAAAARAEATRAVQSLTAGFGEEHPETRAAREFVAGNRS